MGWHWLLRLSFVLYCTTVGILFLLAPWTPGWDHVAVGFPYPGSRIFSQPWVRGGISGFGLIHLVWAIHDLQILVRVDGRHS